jgi:calcineurin-like phosphoesterase family protein
MSHNTFFSSDHHFGHANIITFTNYDGTKLRDFDSVEAMDEHMIAQHNKVVGPKDTCWFLGDVVINRRYLSLISRLNGRKRLVLGNHDIFKNKDYFNAGFEDLHAFRKFDDFVCTHIPVHPNSLGRWGVNVHGHTHSNRVLRTVVNADYDPETSVWEQPYIDVPDERYYCVCMEQLDDYTPIALEDLRAKFNT